jgi:hypothetical protein
MPTNKKFVRTENNIIYLSPISVPKPVVQPEVTHHIFVIDRSGSMCGDMEGLKSSIEQVLAVESFLNAAVETSLISFSSSGDVTLHWSRVPVNKVMDLSGPYLPVLRSIRATALTGISQGLNLALDQVKPEQTTGITLFTDGYANDPSPTVEGRALEAFVSRAEGHPNVFVNCIGYRDWCDWPRMNSIANALSGKCVKATSFKAVLEVMKDTQALLAGSVRPAIKVSAVEGQRLMAVNRTTGQVNMTAEGSDLVLRGTGAEDDVLIFSVLKGESKRHVSKDFRVLPVDEAYLTGALTVGFLNQGQMRAAKEVLFSSGNRTLWTEHQSAMTPSSIAALVTDLTEWVRAGHNGSYEMGRNTHPQYNLFDLADVINQLPPRSIGLDTEEFYKTYRRRSLQKVIGSRLEDGSIQPPLAVTVPREGSRTYIRGVSFNRSDASVQLDTEQAVWVKRLSDGKVFQEVEFVSLDRLRDFRSFTLMSSGERNMDILPIEVYTKDAWKALSHYILPHEAREFRPGQKAKISMKRFRMESVDVPSVAVLSETVAKLRENEAKVKILSAMVNKGEASAFTEAQVAALKALHLSPALFFSCPTTNAFANRDEAISSGVIDSFTRYKIQFCTPQIMGLDDFRSGNAFLDRRYTVTLAGSAVSKPKLDTYLQGATYAVKPPNPKLKDTPADGLMATVVDGILLAKERMTNDEIAAKLDEAKGAVESAYGVFQSLVMEIGCTGLLPVELESQAERMEAEAFSTKYGVKLGKDAQEGIFYVLPGDLVVAIVPEVSWYTVKAVAVDAELDIAV